MTSEVQLDLVQTPDPIGQAVLAFAVATLLALTLLALISALHAMQQDDYSNLRYVRWLWASKGRLINPWLALAYAIGVVAQLSVGTGSAEPAVLAAPLLASVAAIVATIRSSKRAPRKKPLVFTGRAKRLLAASLGLAVTLFAYGYAATGRFVEPHVTVSPFYVPGLAILVMAFVTILAVPAVSMAANLVLAPVQATINWSFRFRAGRKLRRLGPMVVGITGSYGKTSTKYFTEALMGSRFRVLKTRASFNTILGVCRAINEELGPEHEVLIVEMGAYRRGEIRDMARLTRPHIGVLTAIGPQHLERFGSIETIERAKFELLEALPADGIAVVNNDDPRVRRLADTLTVPQVRRYGIDFAGGDLDLRADSIEHGPDGLSFNLINREGKGVTVQTRLIGLHNVSNILASATVAREAGVSLREIAGAIGGLQPVPHRLETHTGPDGVTIIDDAYNSNPVGAFNALDALAEFKTGRKILVTPGMVELGTEHEAWNERLGTKAAATCDYVILVGTQQTAPIRRGLEGAGFAPDRLIGVKNLNDGLEAMKGIVRAGDVVLFENDLPDLYEE